uniref:UvrD-like helicase ATP-binding domain-containing protein n=1 Tax=Anopheles coluzzii TaxID=1518534 RepID=A0A8W7P3H7_ANOCL
MHHGIALLGNHQGLTTQPVQQYLAVSCVEDVVHRITAMQLAKTFRHGQQMQVVITQYDLYPVLLLEHPAQHLQGLRATVDQITGQPQRILARIEFDLSQQLLKWAEAALDIANCLNPPQREAIHHLDGPLLVLAGAGSGKTRVITYKITHLIRHGNIPARHIAAITFTNKAAREMLERVGKLLSAQEIRGITVSTFHSLGMQILRQEAQHLGYKPHPSRSLRCLAGKLGAGGREKPAGGAAAGSGCSSRGKLMENTWQSCTGKAMSRLVSGRNCTGQANAMQCNRRISSGRHTTQGQIAAKLQGIAQPLLQPHQQMLPDERLHLPARRGKRWQAKFDRRAQQAGFLCLPAFMPAPLRQQQIAQILHIAWAAAAGELPPAAKAASAPSACRSSLQASPQMDAWRASASSSGRYCSSKRMAALAMPCCRQAAASAAASALVNKGKCNARCNSCAAAGHRRCF